MHWLAHNVFDHPSASGAAIIAAKTAAVYLILILGLRLLGKRELGQMSLYDLVMIIILGNAVQNAMINGDNTLGGGIVAASVLLVMNRVLNGFVLRSKSLEMFLVGEPVLLVQEGTLLRRNMKRQGVTEDQIFTALREHGIDDIGDVKLAVLEVDGTISVVPAGTPMLRTRRHYRGLRL